MAHCVRFEIYLPAIFKTVEIDSESGEVHERVKNLPDEEIDEFVGETCSQFGGMTRAHPVTPPLFEGYWLEDPEGDVIIDDLTYMYGLVPFEEQENAKTFFEEWKSKFESTLDQEFVLVVYHAVQTIGSPFLGR